MIKSEQGDTLVEVLIATAILGAAIVGGLTIMNFGYAIANNAVERTQVDGKLNSQLSLIRYARDAYVRSNGSTTDGGSRMWTAIMTRVTTAASSQAVCNGNTPQPTNGFYIDDSVTGISDSSVVNYTGAAATTIANPGSGMWVEGRQASADPVRYVDFYVKACWQSIGSNPQQEARTVMRLYVPQ